jgi:hypothetical protein
MKKSPFSDGVRTSNGNAEKWQMSVLYVNPNLKFDEVIKTFDEVIVTIVTK